VQTGLVPENLLLMLGLSFFFGLAFEGFYKERLENIPGGVRTFPLLSLLGLGLYAVDTAHALAFTAGLLVLGAWLFAYYDHASASDSTAPGAEILIPLCSLVAYVLGPISLLQPPWVAVAMTVSAVLFLGAREQLHRLAHRIPAEEIATAGKFLILTGIVLPLLPRRAITPLTEVSPYDIWLAVVVVSSISYGSYLIQRYLWPGRGVLVTALLGGLYSSTATTVVLARRFRDAAESPGQLRAGIVLATALMYLRVGAVVAVFNVRLALALAPALLGLSALGVTVAAALYWRDRGTVDKASGVPHPANPLELSTAFVFAALFVAISLLSTWVKARYGHAGIYALAAIVGVTDIDPFVLSLAQGSVSGLAVTPMVVAILIAASSNNFLKAGYALAFAGWRQSLAPASALLALAAAGLAAARWTAT
jgi:uncharacterized membrane protein (DUF4010 family)